MIMCQSRFFELGERFNKLNEKGPLVGLKWLFDWKAFRGALNKIRKRLKKLCEPNYKVVGIVRHAVKIGMMRVVCNVGRY